MRITTSKNILFQNGIYRIYCLSNKKSYIGMASSFKNKNKKRNGFYTRYDSHLKKLKNNNHSNKYLQHSYNKYGCKNFIFEILHICKPEECEKLELFYIDKYKSMISQNGFNIINQSLSRFNKTTSKEKKEKLSKLFKNKKRNLEIVKKWSNPVIQYDLKGNYINEFYSMSEASRQTGIQRQDIGQSIIGKKCKTAGGFIWKKKIKT